MILLLNWSLETHNNSDSNKHENNNNSKLGGGGFCIRKTRRRKNAGQCVEVLGKWNEAAVNYIDSKNHKKWEQGVDEKASICDQSRVFIPPGHFNQQLRTNPRRPYHQDACDHEDGDPSLRKEQRQKRQNHHRHHAVPYQAHTPVHNGVGNASWLEPISFTQTKPNSPNPLLNADHPTCANPESHCAQQACWTRRRGKAPIRSPIPGLSRNGSSRPAIGTVRTPSRTETDPIGPRRRTVSGLCEAGSRSSSSCSRSALCWCPALLGEAIRRRSWRSNRRWCWRIQIEGMGGGKMLRRRRRIRRRRTWTGWHWGIVAEMAQLAAGAWRPWGPGYRRMENALGGRWIPLPLIGFSWELIFSRENWVQCAKIIGRESENENEIVTGKHERNWCNLLFLR